jgi:hypothetical protein
MPEILTESFCERCGTRYTFESTAPKPRMGRFKTLSKGLKNFVLDDDTSLDEALAAARNEESREATSEQLDAFHKTFNFCMSCRQYTCGNCWNEAEGQCLTCSPVAGRGLSAAWSQGDSDSSPAWPAQATERPGIEAVAWPVADRRPEPAPVADAWPLAALEGRLPAAEEPAVEAEPAAEAAPVAWPEVFTESTSDETADESTPTFPDRPTPAPGGGSLLGRFRPGQSLDEALAAYEASLEAQAEPEATAEAAPAWPGSRPAWPAAEPEPEPVWAEAEPVWAEAEPVAEPEPEPVWAAPEAEPEPAASEPLAGGWPERDQIPWPEPAAEPEPEPEPVAWTAPEQEPPLRPAEDIVEVPTWHVVAPEAPVNGHPTDALRPAATTRPEPQWPGQSAESFLAARLAARKAGDDMWAASSLDVLGPAPAPGAAPVAVQACVSCGLSLSATARFCRRCGTRQG